MEPWLFCFLINIVAILMLAAIGFVVFYTINTQKSKMYGEHCNYDNDCVAGKSLNCQNGVCMCSSTTYYDSISFTGSCGNF